MSRKLLERARTPLLALTVVTALMASTSAWSGQNEDWCFADQEKTPEEALAGCTALIDGGKLSQDKLATAYTNRCLVHTQRNESDLAIADCTQSIAIDPANAEAYAQRGEAYCQKGDLKNCVADFDQAMRIAPDDAAFPSLRGVARGAAGDADGAIADFTKAIELNPEVASNYTRRGGTYEAKGDRESAETDYRKALQLDPEDETAKQRLEAFSNKRFDLPRDALGIECRGTGPKHPSHECARLLNLTHCGPTIWYRNRTTMALHYGGVLPKAR